MSSQPPSAPPAPPRGSHLGLVLSTAALALLGALAVVDQLGPLVAAGFGGGQLPLLAVAALGWLAPHSAAARRGAVLTLYAIGALLAAFTLTLASVTLSDGGEGAGAAAAPLVGLALGLLALLAAPALLLARPVRVAVARRLPLDPDRFHHWLGLVALFWFTAMPLATLPLLGGRPPLQALYEHSGTEAPLVPEWYELLYGLGWTVALCLVAVGFPLSRRLPAALARLGLTWPGWRQLAAGVVLSLLMVPLFLGIDRVAIALVEGLGLATTTSAWIDRLFGRSYGIGGAVAAALSAGLGEEVVWRGVIQPRYGLLLAALGFAALHGFQYGPDGLISVMLAGLLLGFVRRWGNTTVAAVVHGGYDLWLLLGTLLGWW